MLINLEKHESVIAKNVERCRQKGIILPTFREMIDPTKVDQKVKDRLRQVGLWDVDPVNLYRITWHNEPKEKGGLYGGVNFIEIPREITGTKARILALVGKWFPCGVHKVGATYACLAPALVTGNFDASSQQELDSAVEAASEAALANGAYDCCIADTPERAATVWSVRGGILEGMKADSVSQEECDVVVPRSEIAGYVKAAKRIALAHGIRVEPCGHCGDGNIHTEMLRDEGMSDEEWKTATHACLKELYALSKELGGQLSGEHGIGNGRLEFLEEFVGPRMIQLYKSIKLAFDDKLILNPGKIVEFNK